MRIVFRNGRKSPKKGQDGVFIWEINISQQYDKRKWESDCSSEDFTKPKLSLKQNTEIITIDSRQQIVIHLATELDRVAAKVPGLSLACIVVDEISLGECTYFILRWSKELNSLKVSYTERFKSCSEGLKISQLYTDQTLTEDQKDLLWWIGILQSFPKSSVCQEGSARIELLDLCSQWKKGQLNNMLPIMDFIMRTILQERFQSCHADQTTGCTSLEKDKNICTSAD